MLFSGEWHLCDDRIVRPILRGEVRTGVLGRDLVEMFAVIVDRSNDLVCLLGARHRYRIEKE